MLPLVMYYLLGRLVIWLIAFAKPTQWLWNFFEHCDLCLGVWIYFLLGFWFSDVVAFIMPVMYVPVLSQFIAGCAMSFVSHLIRLGWEQRFYNANQ